MGTMVLFEALSKGAIDCYVDYTGTVWSNAMNREDMLSREKILSEMTVWLRDEHGIVNVGPL
jgi:osmoprotectant transport system permease protein